jgi:hypothetical protein
MPKKYVIELNSEQTLEEWPRTSCWPCPGCSRTPFPIAGALHAPRSACILWSALRQADAGCDDGENRARDARRHEDVVSVDARESRAAPRDVRPVLRPAFWSGAKPVSHYPKAGQAISPALWVRPGGFHSSHLDRARNSAAMRLGAPPPSDGTMLRGALLPAARTTLPFAALAQFGCSPRRMTKGHQTRT